MPLKKYKERAKKTLKMGYNKLKPIGTKTKKTAKDIYQEGYKKKTQYGPKLKKTSKKLEKFGKKILANLEDWSQI